MKRYLLFGYDDYYPCGPEGDFIESFDTMTDCDEEVNNSRNERDHYVVLDTSSGSWIKLKKGNKDGFQEEKC